MKKNTKEFELGSIEYRMPNIVESMKLLGQLGFGGNVSGEGQEYIFVSRLIDNMKPLVSCIVAKKGDTVIDCWEDALDHMEFMKPFSEIAAEILEHLNPKSKEASGKNS